MPDLFKTENIIRLKSVNSTNRFALELLKKGNPSNGTIIITDEQTDGKGQDKAKWESEKGKNLTFTLILFPGSLKPELQFILNKSIALGIKDLVQAILPGSTVKIKWPNDIYIGNNKVAGILITNSILGSSFEYSVIGIGININQTKFISDAPNPVSIKMITNQENDLEKVFNKLLLSLENRYNQLIKKDYLSIEKDYHDSLYLLNTWNEYNYKGRSITAMIKGTNNYGKLILAVEGSSDIECGIRELKYL